MQTLWDSVLDFRCVVVAGHNQNNSTLHYASHDI